MTDWKALIQELLGYGLKKSEIAKRVGCARSTLSEIAKGEIENPGWNTASALQELRRKEAQRAARAARKAA